jgi:hypothetical protein
MRNRGFEVAAPPRYPRRMATSELPEFPPPRPGFGTTLAPLLFGPTPQDNLAVDTRRTRLLHAWRGLAFERNWRWAYDHVAGRGTLLAALLGEDPRDCEITREMARRGAAPPAPPEPGSP